MQHIFDWLRDSVVFDDEIANLREQFYVTLRAYLARVEKLNAQDSPALTRVRELLEQTRRPRWSDCYEIEQMLVQLFDPATLRTELQARLLEAEGSLSPRLSEYYTRAAHDVGTDTEMQRALLARLVNDIQWRYTVEEGKRRFSKSLTTRSGVAFLLALMAFGVLAAVTYSRGWRFAVGDLRLLVAAGVSGTWGATFSMLTGLAERIAKSRIYDLNVARAITMVVARALVGAGAACVLFLFFCSGVLTGKAFPDLTATTDGGYLGQSTVALLIIWTFIAGFSEKLVPSLLARTESGAAGSHAANLAQGAPPIRERPTEPTPPREQATPAAPNAVASTP